MTSSVFAPRPALLALVAAALLETAPASAQQPAVMPEPTVASAPEPTVAPTPEPVVAPTAVALPTPAETAVAPATPATPEEPHARLDYSDGAFYLRSVNDNIIFVPSGRMHIDTYTFGGPGVPGYHRSNGTGLKTNLFFRRFILEFGGMIRHRWFYWIGGNFAPTTVDAVQNPISSANVYDGFVGYLPNPRTRIYLGQYNAPFTMENVTSSRWLDLMERALVVRTLATPYNKADGLTLWGETANRSFEYQLGVFGGDGMNRQNIDNAFDGMSRFVIRPLATRSDALKRLHIGFGARVGGRDSSFARYNAPNLSTPGGYTFWSSAYNDAQNANARTDIVPAGLQAAVAAEFYVPFERWDIRGEAVYIHENRREVLDTDRATTLRTGTFQGVGAYAQASFWLHGTPRINGNPAGTYGMTRMPEGLGTQARYGLQLVVRAEIMRMEYSGNSRGGAMSGSLSQTSRNIDVNAYQVGLNYWATKHIRLSAQYSLYQFPSGPGFNQAISPGRAANTAPNSHLLNEISFRLGLSI